MDATASTAFSKERAFVGDTDAAIAAGAEPAFPGAECRLDEVGEYTLFHVAFSEAGTGAALRYGIVLDAVGFRAGLYRIAAGHPLAEAVAESVARSQGGEHDLNALSAFGLLPVDGRRSPEGTGTGDVAIYLAQSWERSVPEPLPGSRRERVDAMQARMLDHGLRAIVERVGHDRLHLYDLIHTGPLRMLDAHPACLRLDREAAAHLREAGRAFPVLARAMGGDWRCLDRGETPHATALAFVRLAGLDEIRGRMVLRRLAGLALPGGVAKGTLSHLRDLPPDWIPAEPESWITFCHLAPALAEAARSTGLPVAALVAHSAGRWKGFAERLAAAAGVSLEVKPYFVDEGDHYPGLLRAAHDIRDMTTDLCTTLVLPLLAWRDGVDSGGNGRMALALASRLLFEGRGLARILACSRTWHRDGGVRIGGRETGTVSWPAVLPPLTCHGLKVVPLATKAALAAEGASGVDEDGIEGLHHCVATRWSACVEGKIRIMGVRRAADGRRLSTFEVAFDASLKPSVNQHRGHRNATTCAAADVALGAYMDALLGGDLAFDPKPLAEARRRGRAGSLEQRCGYDWQDPDNLAAAIAAWSPHLARPYRVMSPSELLEALIGEVETPSGPIPR